MSVKRIALVGVSRNRAVFSRRLMCDLIARGYDVVPVNPSVNEIEGQICYKRPLDITPEVTNAILMTRAESLPMLAKDCAVAGFKSVWILKSSGSHASRLQAVTILNENLIDVIDGLCPYLFLDDAGVPHSLHRGIARLFGTLPK